VVVEGKEKKQALEHRKGFAAAGLGRVEVEVVVVAVAAEQAEARMEKHHMVADSVAAAVAGVQDRVRKGSIEVAQEQEWQQEGYHKAIARTVGHSSQMVLG